MNPFVKNLIVWVAIIGAVLLFYRLAQPSPTPARLMDSSEFSDALKAGKITGVSLPRDATVGGDLNEKGSDGKAVQFLIATPPYRDLVDDLRRQNIAVQVYTPRESSLLTTVLSWLPMLFLIGIWIYFMRTMGAARQKDEAQLGSPTRS